MSGHGGAGVPPLDDMGMDAPRGDGARVADACRGYDERRGSSQLPGTAGSVRDGVQVRFVGGAFLTAVLPVVCEASRAAWERLHGSVLTRVLGRRSARMRRTHAAGGAMEDAEKQREHTARAREAARTRHGALERERAALAQQRLTYDDALERLAELGAALFPPAVRSAEPMLEAPQWEADVLRAIDALIPAEMDRERRTRTVLCSAQKNIDTVLKLLRECLQQCMAIGVPQGDAFHQRVVARGKHLAANRVTPLLLRAKSASGDFYTYIARARIRNPAVLVAPLMELVDLSDLSRHRGEHALGEMQLYASLERSYAQCQRCRTFVREELRVSLERDKVLRAHRGGLGVQIRSAQAAVRAETYELVGTRLGGDAARGASAATVVGPTPMDGDDAASTVTHFTTTSSLTVIEGLPQPLVHAAHLRLRAILAQTNEQTRATDDDEDLPWHSLALGV
ncbi:hypothetical protein MSPP1_003265 [Malassezia sp. CBS 17886]|nr:hypothetical protein MSPP1_003265 [Malassezia sp. CBS 17886]